MTHRRWIKYAVVVFGLHIVGLGLLGISVFHHSTLWGMALLAYTFGLRHAFDVDHIAAIDNTVRKLVQQRKDPTGVGFFFSLGHSTVVACMAALAVFAVQFVQRQLPQFQMIGGMIGTAISGTFLLIIGGINLFLFAQTYSLFLRMRNGVRQDLELEEVLLSRGFWARLVTPLLKLITKSWHVYPIGFLFGLGFDTASEVALLAVSAEAARYAIPFTGVLALPILFAAGMSLMDTADGIFMTTAYRWALSTPLRKVYYNLSVTGLSVLTALIVGFIELVQVLIAQLGLHNGVWDGIEGLSFGALGYILVLLFVLVYGISFCLWRFSRIEHN